MDSRKIELLKAQELREKAEILNREEDALHIVDVDTLSKVGIKTLIHELQVHQIELELQNDELRQIQEELEVSRNKYFGLYNMTPVSYITLDNDGIIIDANLTFCNLLRYPRQQIIKKSITQFILPDDQDIFYKFKKQLAASEDLGECELRITAKDGIQHWARIEATRDLDKESKEHTYHCVFIDITIKKHADELMAEQYRLLQALINSPQDLIYSLDNEYRYTAFNKHYRNEMKNVWDIDIKIGDKALNYMSASEASNAKQNMDRVLNGESYVNIVKSVHNKFYETEWNPIFNEKKEVVGLTAFVKDVTARKKAEEIILDNNTFLEQKVKERTNELEAFSASIAHDLTSPLRTIDGFSQMLLEDYDNVLDLEANRMLNVIKQAANRMHDIINSLLLLAKLSRCETKRTAVDVKKLINEVWAEMENDYKGSVTIEINDVPKAKGDKELIKNVIENLLSNAVKFTRNQPVKIITVSGNPKGKFIEYCISDTGVGFNMDYYDKLFKPFHRLHCDKEFDGTGIGLSVAQKIVNKHNGDIFAKGEVGKGSSFYFTLPAN